MFFMIRYKKKTTYRSILFQSIMVEYEEKSHTLLLKGTRNFNGKVKEGVSKLCK